MTFKQEVVLALVKAKGSAVNKQTVTMFVEVAEELARALDNSFGEGAVVKAESVAEPEQEEKAE